MIPRLIVVMKKWLIRTTWTTIVRGKIERVLLALQFNSTSIALRTLLLCHSTNGTIKTRKHDVKNTVNQQKTLLYSLKNVVYCSLINAYVWCWVKKIKLVTVNERNQTFVSKQVLVGSIYIIGGQHAVNSQHAWNTN